VIASEAKSNQVPIVYVNLVGGQDELVFDGNSQVWCADGRLAHRAPEFSESLTVVEFVRDGESGKLAALPASIEPELKYEEAVYQAIVTGVRDYVGKAGFPGVVLGLSGGIDSALCLAIAVDALRAERVEAVMMPSRYTSDMSLEDAQEMARLMGVKYHVIAIEPMFNAFIDSLREVFRGTKPDTTEENIQARCRGILLMAISNKSGKMVLTTGNKSEMAVGYATLYGDMAGGFAAIKDVPKTLVYRLSEYRNSVSHVIPQRIIDRPPSAELAPDQVDEDSLPPYEVLDPILKMFIEQDQPPREIIAKGYDAETVYRITRMVMINEYKRRQAPPGVRITPRAFGRDRRYPIISGYSEQH
jgi:NAD+ synthase (glutamine-hydrolysing)